MLGEREGVVVGVASSGGEVFLFRFYGSRLGLVLGCGFFLGLVGLLFGKDWMFEGIL